jgi:hypothetical protein
MRRLFAAMAVVALVAGCGGSADVAAEKGRAWCEGYVQGTVEMFNAIYAFKPYEDEFRQFIEACVDAAYWTIPPLFIPGARPLEGAEPPTP